MRTKEERPSVKDVKHSDEVERENFVMEKTEFLPHVQTEEKKENTDTVQSGAVNADMNAAAQQTQMDKFQAAQGHGYAAEQANNLYDFLTGKDAKIVGGDNAKDGPDRMVNGVNIQTKYCHDATSSVQAAFENGQYRYVNAARQMNTAQTQAENRLHKMADDERQYQQKITSIRQERAGMKNELAELIGGIES